MALSNSRKNMRVRLFVQGTIFMLLRKSHVKKTRDYRQTVKQEGVLNFLRTQIKIASGRH